MVMLILSALGLTGATVVIHSIGTAGAHRPRGRGVDPEQGAVEADWVPSFSWRCS